MTASSSPRSHADRRWCRPAITIARGTAADAVVGYEFITAVAVMIFALLAEGFKRPSLFEFPVLLAVLLYGSGLVYVRALERWL